MNKLDQKIDNFLNLNYSDLDDYYKYATEIDINNLRVLLKGYAETENERNIFKKLGDEEVMRKIKSMGIFYTNNPKNIPLHNTKALPQYVYSSKPTVATVSVVHGVEQ